eukprot:TRINITY_DN20227_c0_g1_i1.p1 TRINITY_DN20227_c0_g1~~TRINITY_DN20227_c0_g1_i1.p1  ORF type:complete len:426 (+),score=63.80 TRINITY_DN20227_c0_g1_i1:69-1280(+)
MAALRSFAEEVVRVRPWLPESRLPRLHTLSRHVFGSPERAGHVVLTHRAFVLPQMPVDVDKPEVMFCGESNAGKSSLIRALFFRLSGRGARDLQYGKTPGITSRVSWYNCSDVFKCLDTPGYGFTKSRDERSRRQFPRLMGLIHQVVAARSMSTLHRVYLLSPMLHARLTPHDDALLQVCRQYGVPVCVLLTKNDQCSATQRLHALWNVRDQLAATGFSVGDTVPGQTAASIIPCGINDEESLDTVRMDILHTISKWIAEEDLSVDTLAAQQYESPALSPDALLRITEEHPGPQSPEEFRRELESAAGVRRPSRTNAVGAVPSKRLLSELRADAESPSSDSFVSEAAPETFLSTAVFLKRAEGFVERSKSPKPDLEEEFGSADVGALKKASGMRSLGVRMLGL